jgi:hypothetical protein
MRKVPLLGFAGRNRGYDPDNFIKEHGKSSNRFA